ncbi:hypothetical protein MTO96_046199 [Rhipicephalus appendiculatus]
MENSGRAHFVGVGIGTFVQQARNRRKRHTTRCNTCARMSPSSHEPLTYRWHFPPLCMQVVTAGREDVFLFEVLARGLSSVERRTPADTCAMEKEGAVAARRAKGARVFFRAGQCMHGSAATAAARSSGAAEA